METENEKSSNSPFPSSGGLEVIWTPEQVAEYFQVQRGSVYRWLRQGKVFDPATIIRLSNKIRIPRSEVERVAGMKRDKIMKSLA